QGRPRPAHAPDGQPLPGLRLRVARRVHHAGALGARPASRPVGLAPPLVPGALLRRVKNAAERRAVLHYLLRGYKILGTNVWAGGNELDVIVRRVGRLVFCEVKSKGGPGLGDPLEMVGPEKQRRLRRAAEAWLASHPELAQLEISSGASSGCDA